MSSPPFAIDPETQAYLDEFARQPPRTEQALDDLRRSYRENLVAASVPPDPGVSVQPLKVTGADGTLEGRLYVPADIAEGGPLLAYVHGGGFAVGDLESHDALIRLIARSAGLRVMALDYRRAPEHPFPAARDDVVAACTWARDHAHELHIDPSRIALGGESAGAAHAVAAAIALKGSGLPAAVMILSPALDATLSGDSFRTYAQGTGRTADEFAFLWSLYVPATDAAARQAASPGLADPRGLPPLFVYPAQFDPARDDGEAFAQRAREAGVPVVLRQRAGLIHQSPEITGVSSASRQAVEDAARELAAHLAG